MRVCRAKRCALCTFHGHVRWFCLHLPPASVRRAPQYVFELTTTPTTVQRSVAGVILTSASRSGSEVRITEAERGDRILPGRIGAGPEAWRTASA
jgi:hypothetical protein